MSETNANIITEIDSRRELTISVILMCVLGTLFYAYEYYLRVAPSVMKAELQTTFLLSETAFGYLAACYSFAYTPMQIPVGMLMDRFGPKRIITIACLLCAIGTYIFAFTTNIFIAQAARFFVGFGSAFAYVGVLKIADEWLPKKYFAFIAGLCSTFGMLGAISGNTTMNYLVDSMGWQTTLYYAAFIGILLAITLWMVLRDKEESDSPIRKIQSTSSVVAGLIEIISNKQMWITGLIGCFTFLPISGFAEVWTPSYLITLGFDKQNAGFGTSALFLGFAVGAPVIGWFSNQIKSRRIPLILGSIIATFFMCWIIWFPSPTPGFMLSALFAVGFFASAQILIFAIANDLARPAICATAAAFTNMITMIGGMILPPIIGKVLDTTVLKAGDILPGVHNYSVALTTIPVALLLAAVLSIFLKETCKDVDEDL